jgi:hypothetical protein
MSINGVTTGKSIAQRFAGSFFLSGSQRNSFLPTATVRLTQIDRLMAKRNSP